MIEHSTDEIHVAFESYQSKTMYSMISCCVAERAFIDSHIHRWWIWKESIVSHSIFHWNGFILRIELLKWIMKVIFHEKVHCFHTEMFDWKWCDSIKSNNLKRMWYFHWIDIIVSVTLCCRKSHYFSMHSELYRKKTSFNLQCTNSR